MKDFDKDVTQFGRKVKLRAHFGPGTNIRNTEKQFYKTNKEWEPSRTHHTVATFLESFSDNINKSIDDNSRKGSVNLDKAESQALKDLMKRDDIVICNADKGGAVVILDVKDYVKEAMRQLGDTNFYKVLPNDPTELHCELVNNTIEKFKRESKLTDKLADTYNNKGRK